MRKQLLALTGSVALGVAAAVTVSGPAGSIQLAPGLGTDAHVILTQDRDRGGRGPSGFSGQGGGGGDRPSLGLSGRSRGGDGPSFGARGDVRGDSGPSARGSVQFQDRDGRRDGPPARGQVQRRDSDRDYSRRSARGDDRDHFRGRLEHRGWSRDRKHRFFGAVLIGVPFGYAALATHPCYDWVYGPQGWGYYWNYGRCPV